MITRLLVFTILLLGTTFLSAQLTIIVDEVPMSTPATDNIHIAGDFQGWDPSNPDYALTNNGDGTYQITINPSSGTLKFKFARGSWEKVEGNANGGFLPDRTYSYSGNESTVTLQILSWEDLDGGPGNGNSTAADNVFILDEDFYIPQLNRNRRIWMYLPPDYNDSEKDYPVLYMHDGQNVFDASTSFSGEWEVDESLNELFEDGDYGCIVVAIDNGGVHRIDEYSPWVNPQYGGGQGDDYLEFIVETLKPYIDANYRTRPEREYTALMGSSLGGLISHYGIVEHQDVFSKAGIFSPSYWFSDEVFSHTIDTEKDSPVRMYMIVGQNEGPSMTNGLNNMYNTLLNNDYSTEELFKEIHSDGEHSEWYWRREFPDAYEWLFAGIDLTPTEEVNSNSQIKIYPNPTDSLIKFDGLEEFYYPYFELYSSDSKLVKRNLIFDNQLNISYLKNGIYYLKVMAEGKVLYADKIILQN